MNKKIKRYLSICLFTLMIGELINYAPVNAQTPSNSKYVEKKSENNKEPKVTIDSSVKLLEDKENQKIKGKGNPGDTVIFRDKNNKDLEKIIVEENGQFEATIKPKLSSEDKINVYEYKKDNIKSISDSVIIDINKKSVVTNKTIESDKYSTNFSNGKTMLNSNGVLPANPDWFEMYGAPNKINTSVILGHSDMFTNETWLGINDFTKGYIVSGQTYEKDCKIFYSSNPGDIDKLWLDNNHFYYYTNDKFDNVLTIVPPRYILMDPNNGTPTFMDENGKIPKISGSWGTINKNENLDYLYAEVGLRNDPAKYWQWYSSFGSPDVLKYYQPVNSFEGLDISSALNNLKGEGISKNLGTLPVNQKYGILFGMANSVGWTSDHMPKRSDWSQDGVSIPFYIKAPKVEVKTDDASLNKMLTNQQVSGKGQPGDTVTIKSADGKTWTGTVNSDGTFTIDTNGLEPGNITITEVNGTGDKSISDPVKIRVNRENLNITKQPKYVIMDPNGGAHVLT